MGGSGRLTGRRRRTARRWLAAPVAVLLLAGCGSTVQPVAGTGAESQLQGEDLSVNPSGSAAQAGTDGSQIAGPAGSGTLPGQVGSEAGTGDAATADGAIPGGSVTAGGGTTTLGPGITATTISMGLEYSSQAAQESKAIGASGATPKYDPRDVINTIMNYANTHGGFAGRKLQPIWYDVNNNSPREVEDQAACSTFTEDHKVFAMVGSSDILRACAEKAGAISMVDPATVASTYQRFPHFIAPYNIRLDRLAVATANGLFHAHYFTGRLGLVTWDDNNYKYAMTHGYLPTLASHDIKPAVEPVYITVPQQVGALGDMSAAVSSAITKFKAEGIDHVIVQDGPAGVFGGTGLTLSWMENAESQRYFPRYGQNSGNSPGWSLLPSDQQDRAIAIVSADFDPSYDAGWRTNKARDRCYSILAKAGYPIPQDGPNNDEGVASQACDQVFFLQRVINSLGATLTNTAFIQQAAQIGSSFENATVYGTNLFPGRRDGLALFRTAQYDAGCKCLRYSSKPFRPE